MRWLAGDEARRETLLRAIARLERGEGVTWLRAREGRRRLGRIALDGGRSAFAKHYLRPDRHRVREWWKRRLHLTTAEREWRALVSMFDAGIRVPEPLAHVRLASGEQMVVSEWIDGAPLGDALPEAPGPRRKLLADLGALVRRLHAAGWAHRDLHRENVLVADTGLFLIDLQAARRGAGAVARRRDLGRLDFSLRRALSLPDRLRLRAAALGASRPFEPRVRTALRAVGDASLERGRIHAASRARRSLRVGRRARRFDAEGMTGLASRDADEAALRAALVDARAVDAIEIRRYTGSPRDLWRGSAARRAWAVAHALEASDLPGLTPLAFLERRRLGWPTKSSLALARGGDEPSSPEGARRLREQLDEAGFDARDLVAAGIIRNAADTAATVSALEQVRFPTSALCARRRRPRGRSPRGNSSTSP